MIPTQMNIHCLGCVSQGYHDRHTGSTVSAQYFCLLGNLVRNLLAQGSPQECFNGGKAPVTSPRPAIPQPAALEEVPA